MITVSICLAVAVIVIAALSWYALSLLGKLMDVSQSMSDLFLTVKAFQVFVKTLYSMDSYHGEPMVEELVQRIKKVSEEIEEFRDVFEYTLDLDLERELNDAEKEE
jgi:hypothetical protein